MKRYYNSTTNRYYLEGSPVTHRISESSVFSGIPSEEMLFDWGYELIEAPVQPELTDELLLENAKQQKINDISMYDSSSNVNSFTIGDTEMWLDAETRLQLRTSINAYAASDIKNVSKWFDGVEYTFTTDLWLQMLNALEVYAAESLNTTERHKSNVSKLTTIESVEEYDYTTGYPAKLLFTLQ